MYDLYTVWHSTLSIYSFLENVQKHWVKKIIDVRAKPYSTYNPQYSQKAFKQKIEENGIEYVRAWKILWGFWTYWDEKRNDWIEKLLRTLEKESVCIMCSEWNHKDCHRRQRITKDVKDKCQVKHITTTWDIIDEEVILQSASLF